MIVAIGELMSVIVMPSGSTQLASHSELGHDASSVCWVPQMFMSSPAVKSVTSLYNTRLYIWLSVAEHSPGTDTDVIVRSVLVVMLCEAFAGVVTVNSSDVSPTDRVYVTVAPFMVEPCAIALIVNEEGLPVHTGSLPVTSTDGAGLMVTCVSADSIPQSVTMYAV